MNFIYPSFLWALLAIAIPVLIHLFYFRRFRKVYFTNVRFLKEVKEETSSKTRLKHLLVLLARILTVIFLVFAFAQPFIPRKNAEIKKGQQAVSIFIDNSFSMSSLSEDVPLMEKARKKAREIVNAYRVDDQFQILTNDFERRHQRLVSKEDALSLVDEVKISPAVKEMSRIYARQKQALNLEETENKSAYLISDFQKNIVDFGPEIKNDSSIDINLLPLQSVRRKNVSIDSCWFESPVQMINQTNPLIVKIRNYSDEDMEDVRLSLSLDGQVKPVGSLSVKARSEATDTVNVTILKTGWHEAKLSITDYPVQFDDTYFFAFNVAEQINIMTINQAGTNPYLDALFSENPYFKVENVLAGKIDYSSLSGFQLIILNELSSISSGMSSEFLQYAQNGGNILVFPSRNADLGSYRSFLSAFRANSLEQFDETARSVSYINIEEFVFKDVFENTRANFKLPDTKGNFTISRQGGRAEEVLLRFRDGGTFLAKYQAEKGNLFLCASPLDLKYSNLTQSGEIFVPMVYKMAIAGTKEEKIAYTIGKDNVLETDNRITSNEMVYKMKGEGEEFIPEQKNVGPKTILNVDNLISEAGFYNLFLESGTTLKVLAFNFDRKESDLDYFEGPELENLASGNINIIKAGNSQNLTLEIEERKRGVQLWKWCLILALIFIFVEILLLRLWKS